MIALLKGHMKLSAFVLLLLLSIIAGCSGGTDAGKTNDASEEQQISGDSVLRLTNGTEKTQSIYFDDMFIGNVEEDQTREWNVPSGSHKVTSSDNVTGEFSDTFVFQPGTPIILTVQFQPK